MTASASLVSGEVYMEDDWPHGLSCSQCPHVFSAPERYSERLYAFLGDQPLVEVLCIPCATNLPSRSAP